MTIGVEDNGNDDVRSAFEVCAVAYSVAYPVADPVADPVTNPVADPVTDSDTTFDRNVADVVTTLDRDDAGDNVGIITETCNRERSCVSECGTEGGGNDDDDEDDECRDEFVGCGSKYVMAGTVRGEEGDAGSGDASIGNIVVEPMGSEAGRCADGPGSCEDDREEPETFKGGIGSVEAMRKVSLRLGG